MDILPYSPYCQADDHSLAVFAKLLGVEGAQMAQWLCHRRLAVGGEMLVKPMTGQQANDSCTDVCATVHVGNREKRSSTR